MTDELDAKVTVRVAGDDIEVSRPPFRRLRTLLPMVVAMGAGLEDTGDGSTGGEVDLTVLVDVGEELARVLFGPDEAEKVLDRLYTAQHFGQFVESATSALQLGEANASTGS